MSIPFLEWKSWHMKTQLFKRRIDTQHSLAFADTCYQYTKKNVMFKVMFKEVNTYNLVRWRDPVYSFCLYSNHRWPTHHLFPTVV